MRVAAMAGLTLLLATVTWATTLSLHPDEAPSVPDHSHDGPMVGQIPPFQPPRPDPVRFLAWGDAGTGDETQRAVAEGALRVCGREGCDFVLQLGDNVYPDGVRGVDDPQWEAKFEAPYADFTVPFYAALGNHDVALGDAQGTARDNGDHQVAYALRDDRSSDKWTMPGRHYAFREGNLQVVVLDLTGLVAEGADLSREADQLAWLGSVWDEDVPWRIAVSHFPYVSNGAHGDAGRYDGVEGRGAALAEVVEAHVCGKAHLYLAGHDHHLEWRGPVPSCDGTEHVISGAAAAPRPLARTGAPALFSLGGVAGFFWFEATADALTGRAYDAHGNVLFERTLRADGPGPAR